MTNLEKAQAWVDSRAIEGRDEDALTELIEWEAAARRSRTNIDDYAEEKYGWVLRAIELKNSDDPFAIMTASELAFAERMCDREPRVYLEGAALEEHRKGMAVAKAEGDARRERSRIELLERERAKPPYKKSGKSFEELFQ
jgi:hypothetical protein